MSNNKLERLESQIRREISNILQNEVKNSKFGFVTVTDVEVTSDYSFANVYVSFLNTKEVSAMDRLEEINRVKGFVRTQLSQRLKIRKTPDLIFKIDDSIDQGNRIDELLAEINQPQTKQEEVLKIFGCSNHMGVSQVGLTQGLNTLRELDDSFVVIEVPEVITSGDSYPNLKNYDAVYETNKAIAETIDPYLEDGWIALNILGDHSASIGTVSAASKHVERLGVIWVDAHPDLHTEDTSVSGNIHGMTLGSLLGLGNSTLQTILTDEVKVHPQDVVYLGLRDIDEAEALRLSQLNLKTYLYSDVQEKGLDVVLNEIKTYLSEVDEVHVSLDLDVHNPKLIPGVSVPVLDGFEPEETKKIITYFLDNLDLISMDIVEFNPQFDQDHKTANLVLDLIKLVKSHYKFQ